MGMGCGRPRVGDLPSRNQCHRRRWLARGSEGSSHRVPVCRAIHRTFEADASVNATVVVTLSLTVVFLAPQGNIGAPGTHSLVRMVPARPQAALTAATSLVSESLASPNSMVVLGSKSSSLSMPANPGRIERFR